MLVITKFLGKKIPNLRKLIQAKIYIKKELEKKVIEEVLELFERGLDLNDIANKYEIKYTSLYGFLQRNKESLGDSFINLNKKVHAKKSYEACGNLEFCVACGEKCRYARYDKGKKMYYNCNNLECEKYVPLKKGKVFSEEEKIEICQKYYELIPMKQIAKEHNCSYYFLRKFIRLNQHIVAYSKK